MCTAAAVPWTYSPVSERMSTQGGSKMGSLSKVLLVALAATFPFATKAQDLNSTASICAKYNGRVLGHAKGQSIYSSCAIVADAYKRYRSNLRTSIFSEAGRNFQALKDVTMIEAMQKDKELLNSCSKRFLLNSYKCDFGEYHLTIDVSKDYAQRAHINADMKSLLHKPDWRRQMSIGGIDQISDAGLEMLVAVFALVNRQISGPWDTYEAQGTRLSVLITIAR